MENLTRKNHRWIINEMWIKFCFSHELKQKKVSNPNVIFRLLSCSLPCKRRHTHKFNGSREEITIFHSGDKHFVYVWKFIFDFFFLCSFPNVKPAKGVKLIWLKTISFWSFSMRESQAQLCGTWKICVDDERGCVSLAESAKKQKIRIEYFVCCDINARPSTPMTKQNHFNWMWCYCLCFVVSVRIEKTSRVQRQVNRTINCDKR